MKLDDVSPEHTQAPDSLVGQISPLASQNDTKPSSQHHKEATKIYNGENHFKGGAAPSNQSHNSKDLPTTTVNSPVYSGPALSDEA